MSGWVHVKQGGRTDMCLDLLWPGNPVSPFCGCTTPTPDPASPCGRIAASVACGYPASDPVMHGAAYGHPHQPTRCTCGHPIEERA